MKALAFVEPLTPKNCETVAWLSNTGDYWIEWNIFYIAQQLFVDKVVKVDDNAWNKLNKKTMDACTIAVHKWFNELPKSTLEEVKKVTTIWNKLGCPDREKHNV